METKPSWLYRSALILFLLIWAAVQFGGWGVRPVKAEEEANAADPKIYLPVVMKAPFVPPEPVVPSSAPDTNGWPGGMIDVTYDPNGQHMFVYNPSHSSPVPLLVGLHTWSRDYTESLGTPYFDAPYAQWAIANQWVYINPNFRGPNNQTPANPPASSQFMGSDYAVQDVVDAVNYAIANYNIDPHRIYLVGQSGGGHMALLMAARHPELWTAVSVWAGISDLPAWYYDYKALYPPDPKYSNHIQAVCGIPSSGSQAEIECLHRSSVNYFPGKSEVIPPLDINAGIQDGHYALINGAQKLYPVPLTHSTKVFNLLAKQIDVLPGDQITQMWGSSNALGSIPALLAAQGPWPDSLYDQAVIDTQAVFHGAQPIEDKHVMFRRQSGNVRLTIFNGNHEIIYWAALYWLSRQWKP